METRKKNPMKARSDSRTVSLLSTIKIFLAVFLMEGEQEHKGCHPKQTAPLWHFLSILDTPEIFRSETCVKLSSL